MNKKIYTTALMAALAASGMAQKSITATEIANFEKQNHTCEQGKALRRAIANVAIDELAKTSLNGVDLADRFSIETPKQNIHNQLSSGRCWMFSSFNVLRSDFAHKHGDTMQVEFSHAYTFFYDQLEKANLMLQGVIDNAKLPMEHPTVSFFFKSPIGDGGTFCGAVDLTAKYGVVPMSAQPETFTSESTSRARSLVASKLREYGLELRRMVEAGKKAKEVEAKKVEMLGTIYKMLSMTLGEPVKKFTYEFRNKKGEVVVPAREYTPKEFYNFTVGHNLDGTCIMVMNDPRRPYHKTYEVEYDRHTYDGHNWKYLNLPVEEIAQMAIAQLKAGRKMYSSYDVGKQSNRKTGLAALGTYDYGTLFGTEFPMNKADRIATFDSGSTHAMTLTAVDLDAEGKPTKWKVENSWGASSGVKGCMIMTNEWWNEYMFRLVVDKEFVPANIIKEYEQKPTMVTPDDPLFGLDD